MLKFKAREIKVEGGVLGLKLSVQLPFDKPLMEKATKLKPNKVYRVEIVEDRQRRSLSANNYAWVLCQEIAKHLSKDGTYFSKEAVYRTALQDCGPFTFILVEDKAVQDFKDNWSSNGIGWIVQEDESRNGFTSLRVYAGSSTYNTAEMSRLIECLIDQCRELGIPTEEEAYVQSLLDDWRANHEDE